MLRSTEVQDPHLSFIARQVTVAGRIAISGAKVVSNSSAIFMSSDSGAATSLERILAIISGTISRSSAFVSRAGIEITILPPCLKAEMFLLRRFERITMISPSSIPGKVCSISPVMTFPMTLATSISAAPSTITLFFHLKY